MNKEIVEHYGWIVVVLIIGLTMMMMSTPLGNYVYSNVRVEAVDALIESKQNHKASAPIEDDDLLTTYKISYNINGGVWEGNYITTYIYGKETTLPTNLKHTSPEKYTFAGWYIKGTNSSNIITNIPATQNGNIELVASWIGKEYTITYNTNGGIFTTTDYVTHYRYNTDNIALPTSTEISKSGYKFLGWYQGNDFAGSSVSSIHSNETTGNVTYYAKWEKK